MRTYWLRYALLTASLILHIASAQGQKNVVVIDATAPDEPATPVTAKLGTLRNPDGRTLTVNSKSLLLDGKPWLPVMGEIHFSRVPAADWEDAILKMKSAGVSVVASYIFWIHHEQNRGTFDWSGNKDIRRFAELCARHGMYFYPRIGPWAHGEARNGGFPDWVAAQPHLRQDDPQYLGEVETLYQQIGQQLRGLYWKDGGPVIGLQLENEYVATGPGKGADHIRTLKRMAVAAGMDVPLYTVTGWGSAATPSDAVLPVFGGYPDAPWDSSTTPVPPPEVYEFRFDSRATGNMGNIGGNDRDAVPVDRSTPFLTAELGGGIQDTYFRRPVVSTDDIAAMLPVMLGSGVNLVGYYMFHGGRNPDGGDITLQESQRTGYPTDVPTKSYDFHAPIGNNGEERESLRRLKLVHYFLKNFGEQLAPMTVRRPAVTPSSADDLSVPRVAARTSGDQGFVFLNNYTRHGSMPPRPGFQVQLKLQKETLSIPQEPITLASGVYGIWPVNLDLQGVRLRYSTAQLLNRLDRGDDVYTFFFAIPGVVPEFLLDTPSASVDFKNFASQPVSSGLLLRAQAQTGEIVVKRGKQFLHLVLLPRTQAENLWTLDDASTLLLTKADVIAGPTTVLQQEGNPRFEYSLFGPPQHKACAELLQTFTAFHSAVQPASVRVALKQTRSPGTRPAWIAGPKVEWRKETIAMAPEDKDFERAGLWDVTLSGDTHAPQLANVLLRIHYRGDVARITQNGRLLDDDFWNGVPWSVGTKQVGVDPLHPLTLQVLPLPLPFPMYIEQRSLLGTAATSGQIGEVPSVDAVPVYQLQLPAIENTMPAPIAR